MVRVICIIQSSLHTESFNYDGNFIKRRWSNETLDDILSSLRHSNIATKYDRIWAQTNKNLDQIEQNLPNAYPEMGQICANFHL